MQLRERGTEGHRRGEVVAALGPKPHLRDSRIAAGLVYFPPAFVGRAPCRYFTTGTGEPILENPLAPEIARRVADLVEARGTNVWFDLSDAEILKEFGYEQFRWTRPQRHARTFGSIPA